MNDDKAFYVALGLRIAHCRTARAMTQKKLGEALNPRITRAAISNIEKGNQRVLVHTLCAMAEVLGVDLLELVPLTRREPRPAEVVKKSLEKTGLSKEASADFASVIATISRRAKGRAA